MPTRQASWAAVEEKLAMDFTIWKSKTAPESRPDEQKELVEEAGMKMADRGLAIVSIGKLEWELTPPSGYTGYCEKQDDWLLVSRSGFRVALRCPHGSGALQVCPRGGDMESLQLDGGVDMTAVISRFFTSGDVRSTAPPILRRTLSQKKRAEIIGMKFSGPFVTCVNSLRNAIGIADVLDTILAFSAVYMANQPILQPVAEDSDMEDSYFYDIEGLEELRSFNIERRKASAWVRQQVREAAMKCHLAAEATSEAAKLGARMLQGCSMHDPTLNKREEKSLDPMETEDSLELNRSPGLQIRSPEGSIAGPFLNVEDMLPPGQDSSSDTSGSPFEGLSWKHQYEFDSWEDRIDGLTGEWIKTGSERPSDVGMETSSASSWEFVRGAKCCDVEEEEDDILGSGISDAESLSMMLRGRDPFGCNDCSHLVNEFLSLSLNPAASSPSTDQERSVDGNESRKSTVLKRLQSWSSSNSGWSSSTDRDGPSSGGRKLQPLQLETLAEEPSCDPDTASVCRSFVMNAAVVGDVLQWCSCKFNKLRGSIELRFQVGSFMDDDIATLSTGLSRASPLRIEIFLDTSNVRQSLLQGRVRISADQGAPQWPNEDAPPVIGLSCYIPHLVRNYLQQVVRNQADKGYDFPDGELLTGLMKHVVDELVFLKYSCCVCHQTRMPDMIMSVVPKPCDLNLCQALHDLWLAVAPPMVLERSTVETWLRNCCFEEGVYADEDLMLQYMGDAKVRLCSYEIKLNRVMEWIKHSVVAGSWLKLVQGNDNKTAQELHYTSDMRAFPRKTDAEVSFEPSLKAWQARYQRVSTPSRLGINFV